MIYVLILLSFASLAAVILSDKRLNSQRRYTKANKFYSRYWEHRDEYKEEHRQ